MMFESDENVETGNDCAASRNEEGPRKMMLLRSGQIALGLKTIALSKMLSVCTDILLIITS